MNKVKSLFIAIFPMVAMGLAIYAIVQMVENGVSKGWAGVILSTLPIISLIGYLMMFKSKARVTPYLPGITLLALLGFGLATFEFFLGQTSSSLPILLSTLGLMLFALYNFWYSSLGRELSKALEPGISLPEFELLSQNGTKASSGQIIDKPTVLIFYRGNWCPLCMAQVKEIASTYHQLDKLGAQVLLISPQPQEHTRSLAKKFKVPLQFFTDKDNRAARRLRIAMPNGLPAGMEILGYDKDTVYPTVIITDQHRVVIYNDQTNDYRIRPEPNDFLKVLARLNDKQARTQSYQAA